MWHIRRPGSLPDIRVIGEYQGEEFHSSPDQRKRDDVRRRGLEAAGWLVLEIWKSDMATTEARRATVLRFATELGIPVETLDLSGCEPRFFSQYALDLAIQRDDRRRGRGSRH